MIIFYGTRSTQKVLGQTPQIYRCSECGHDNYFEVIRSRRWFTLFFIPLIPLGTKYLLHCPSCNSYFKLKKEEAEAMVQQSRNAQQEA